MATRPVDKRVLVRNRIRFREEVTEGIRALLTKRHTQAWVARRLEKSPALISQMLEGSNNFEIDSLADLSLALGRGVHIVFGMDTDEMRLAVDEGANAENTTVSHFPIDESGPFSFAQYQRAGLRAANTLSGVPSDPVAINLTAAANGW